MKCSISLNRPTGPIRSISRKVCPWRGDLSPFHAILPGEQRRSNGGTAVSHRGLSTLKKMYIKKCTSLRLVKKMSQVESLHLGFLSSTELQLLYILILERTCLVVLVAKHPILYIASLFCYIPL